MRFLILISILLSPAWAKRSFHDPEVQDALEALKEEPSIQQTQGAALRFFNIDPDTVSSMRSRASWKAVLPDLTVKYIGNQSKIDVDKFNIPEHGDEEPANIDDAGGSLSEFQVSGNWSLSRLLFNPEVLDVSSLAVLQEGVLKEITRLYFTRRRLQVGLIFSPPKDPATQYSKELRIQELTATLDAMTGNIFTKSEQRRARKKRRRRG